jgi:MFS family permease
VKGEVGREATPAPSPFTLHPSHSPAPSHSRLPPTFRSFRHRDFRFLWCSTIFSSFALWIQQTTLSWLTYELTGSALLLGAVNGARSVPLLLFAPFGGVAADRFDRKRLLLTTQVGLLVATLLFGVLIFAGHLQVWHIFAFTMLTGVAWSFNMPVRQSLMPNIVPREDLMNAVALGSAAFSSSRIIGPALAGLLIASVGVAENFFVQAAAYVGVTLMVLQLRLPLTTRAQPVSVLANLKEGVRFIWRHPTLRVQMTLALAPVVIALPYNALLPIFASDVLGVGPEGFGLMMAAPGLGAIVGTLGLASVGQVRRQGLLMLGTVLLLGLSLIAFSFSRSFPLSLLLLFLVGAIQMVYFTTNQAMLQLSTPDELRGRVMGVFVLNQGLLPLGALFAGALADLLGAPTAVAIMGALVALLAAAFAARSSTLRSI